MRTPTTSGRTPGSTASSRRITDGLVGLVEQVETEDDPDDDRRRRRPARAIGRSAGQTRRQPPGSRPSPLRGRTGRRGPHPSPIEPRSHSPINSDTPMTSRKTAKMTSTSARAPSARTRPTWPAIAPASPWRARHGRRPGPVRITGGLELFPQAGRLGARLRAAGRAAHPSCGRRLGGWVALGSSRVVAPVGYGAGVRPDDASASKASGGQRHALRWRRWPPPRPDAS